MVAVPLIFGRLTAADYEDDIAKDPRIDALRKKITCVEDKRFTRDYHDPKKRSIANALTVEFKDGSKLEGSRVRVPDRPQAPPRRGHADPGGEVQDQSRAPLPPKQQKAILDICMDPDRLEAMPVNEFVDLFVV